MHQNLIAGSALVTMLDARRLHVVHTESEMPSEILDLDYTQTAFGGRRAWFVCSKLGCGMRVAVLHATQRGFRCRHCMRLSYASTHEQPFDRVLRRIRTARFRLGASSPNLMEPFPEKPPGMHQRTYRAIETKELLSWSALQRHAIALTDNRQSPLKAP
jgi:hypothetical protein